MSRQLTNKNGRLKETMKNEDECAWLYDEVCCNADSEFVADYPHEYCRRCRYFVREQKC